MMRTSINVDDERVRLIEMRPNPRDARSLEREEAQRRALRRNRLVATALLVGMASVFVATSAVPDGGFWTRLIHAVAEAGVVGGLADWFAVTAVFRRPLGLPIPHTAVVPRNKARIGEGLGAFLERHFLNEELVLTKLRDFDPAQRLARWLADPRNADAIAERAVHLLPHALNALNDEELRSYTARALAAQLRTIDVAPFLGKGVALLTAGGYHEAVIDRGVEVALEFLERNGERLEEAAGSGERRRWWIPKAVDRQIARALIKGLRELLDDLRTHDSRARQKVLRAIDELARDLVVSPERRMNVEATKQQILDRADVQQWLGSVWDEVREFALGDIDSLSSKAREGMAAALASIGRALLADANMRERLNRALETAVADLLPWRSELARFVADVVRRWDERVLVERMELALGADLQYLRITGTLVGASIGCLLFLLSLAFQ
jgi:uncharacterized membrane-anchored protein YjiN (DUF445 family)